MRRGDLVYNTDAGGTECPHSLAPLVSDNSCHIYLQIPFPGEQCLLPPPHNQPNPIEVHLRKPMSLSGLPKGHRGWAIGRSMGAKAMTLESKSSPAWMTEPFSIYSSPGHRQLENCKQMVWLGPNPCHATHPPPL